MSALSVGGSCDVTIVYGWYSDNSVLLEDPGVYYKFYGILRYLSCLSQCHCQCDIQRYIERHSHTYRQTDRQTHSSGQTSDESSVFILRRFVPFDAMVMLVFLDTLHVPA